MAKPTALPDSFVKAERAAVSTATDALVLVDLDGVVLGASRPLADALGVDRDAIVGQLLYDSLPSGETSDLPVLVTGLLTNGRRRVDTHATAVTPKGESVDLTLSFELVNDPAGNPALLRVSAANSLPQPEAQVVDARPSVADRADVEAEAEQTPIAPTLPVRRGAESDPEDVGATVTPSGRDTPPPPTGAPPTTAADPNGPVAGANTGSGTGSVAGTSAAGVPGTAPGPEPTAMPTWLAPLLDRHPAPAAAARGWNAPIEVNGAAALYLGLGGESKPTLDQLLAAWGVDPSQIAKGERGELTASVPIRLERTGAGGTVNRTEASLLPLPLDGDGQPWILLLGDPDDLGVADAKLAHQATHDPLTGLPNRLLLLDRLQNMLDGAERDGTLVAVAFFDLDRFKQVNDTLGHDAGDELLRLVAHRISSVVRPSDVVARLGGDEFIIVCEAVDDESHALEIVRRVSAAIDARPFMIDDTEVPITSSGGISLSFPGAHPEGLLRDADAAMYRSKHQGRARLEVFDDEMRSQTSERLRRAEELADALDGDQISVEYQPTVSLQDGRLFSVEALARWPRPDGDEIAPAEFIELAEASGLVIRLGLKVLHRACVTAAAWSDVTESPPPIQVNISPRQLAHANFPVLVQGLLESVGLAPELLCLEITESALMEDTAASMGTLDALRDLGVRLAIDDFGTGYSSLSYLSRLPVDLLKIDASFVDGIAEHGDDRAIVSAIINLAHSLGMNAIAEGVETEAQAEVLRQLGCDGAQGFRFARPGSPEDIEKLIRA